MAARPVRCFTCKKPLTDKMWETVCDVTENEDENKAQIDSVLDNLGLRRMCCRRMFLTHPFDLEKKLLLYHSEKGEEE